MTQIVSSISGIEVWAPSAGSASRAMNDKNGRDLSKCVDQQGASAIASAYQVVSATATQLYAGTAYLTHVNTAPISAARAGNAANASMANSAYYDGTGRLISSLPDAAEVSAIASAYADDKLDKTAQVVTATAGDGTYVTSINGMEISGQGGGGGGGGDAFPVDYNSGSCSASLETGYFVSTSRPSLTLSSTGTNIYPRFIVRNGTGTASKGSYYLSDAFEFTTGAAGGSGTKVLRVDPQQVSSKNFLLFGPSGSNTYGTLALGGADDSAYVRIGSGTEGHVNYVRPSSISSWWDVHDTVSANSATWGGGGGVVTSTASASAGDPLIPIYYVNEINGSGLFAVSAGESEFAQYDTNGRLLLEIPGSAEVSAIASAYSESAASSKLDSSASSSFYTTANESGFITGVDLTDYATTSYVDSAVSGKLDSSSQVVTATAGDGTYVTAINGMGISGQGGGGATGDYVEKSAIMVDIGSGNTSYTSNSAVFIQGYSNNNNGNNFVFIQGRSCTAGDGVSFLQGEQNSGGDSYSFAQGGSNRSKRSLVQGTTNTAFAYSLAQGNQNQAYDSSLAQGNRNTASSYSLAQGNWNKAYGDAFAQGVNNQAYDSSLAQGDTNIASSNSMAQGYWNRAYGDSFAQGEENTASSISVSLGIGNSADTYSIAHGFHNSALDFGVAVGIYTTAAHTAAVFGQYNLHGDGDVSTGDSAAFVIGDGTDTAARHDLMLVTKDGEITMYSSTADTVGTGIMSSIRAISAAATGGGVDSATVSAIASSYAQDVSAAVSGTVDTVSSQSANWGGSALALSAGPGVKLELSGSTLVASTDETVLYSATAYAPGDTQQSYSLIETPMNFETVRVLAYRPLANGAPWFGSVDIQIANLYNYTAANTLMAMPYAFVSTANNIFYEGQYFINNITSTSWEDGSSTQRKTTETAYTTGYYAHIYKIIGINRTAGV